MLVGKLIYLNHTRLNIAYDVNLVMKFMMIRERSTNKLHIEYWLDKVY